MFDDEHVWEAQRRSNPFKWTEGDGREFRGTATVCIVAALIAFFASGQIAVSIAVFLMTFMLTGLGLEIWRGVLQKEKAAWQAGFLRGWQEAEERQRLNQGCNGSATLHPETAASRDSAPTPFGRPRRV
jgi:hypothetical protein